MAAGYETLIEPIKNKRTFEEVSDRLKELIFDGVFKPGQQLPSENALAQMFQVGRQSVREALRVLEISGFISTKPGIKGGAVIEGTALSRLSSLFLDTFKFHKANLEDCIVVRRAVEMAVLDSVLTNADPSDIEELRNSIAKARAIIESENSAFEENIEFHRLLAKASRNVVFSIVIEALLTVYLEFKSQVTKVTLQQSRKIMETHAAVVEAIVEKNRGKAVELLEKDLALGGRILVQGRGKALRPPGRHGSATAEQGDEAGKSRR
jgi:GntR family transcriptional regulator, transcriptional repressor for pyruvate dehydrogenase complex